MKIQVIITTLALTSSLIFVASPKIAASEQETVQEKSSIVEVSRIAIAPVIENREPQNASDKFSADIGNLYCFTHVVGAETPTHVVHKWYYNDELRSAITLAVNSISWRTFSLIPISPEQTGSWRVDIVHGESEEIIKTAEFEIE
ncbi:hypothetical protein CHISP_1909 [Chitinispirillum alkaliphilum]|nr:hypothetical protein CHISP_1909 [Chitinispirillum alkaliphilum]